MNESKGKLIWAVNPTKNPTDAKALVKEMKIWAKKLDCEIQPVAVFSKLNIGFPPQLNLSWEKSFEELAKATLKNYIKKLGSTSFLEPQAIFAVTLSNRKMAFELASYAKKSQAKIIFANTRIKKTANPIRLGGFAETLISLSEVPVLLMNPSVESNTKKKSILFPTDLSVESEQALTSIKPWVTALQANLILFNQVEFPDFYANDFGAATQINEIMKEAESARKENLQKVQKRLQADHIKSEVVVAKSHKYLGAQIIEVARKNKVELIVVTNHAGPLYQAVLGSVSRDVLVQAKCPVLILRHVHEEKQSVQNHGLKKSGQDKSAAEKMVSTL